MSKYAAKTDAIIRAREKAIEEIEAKYPSAGHEVGVGRSGSYDGRLPLTAAEKAEKDRLIAEAKATAKDKLARLRDAAQKDAEDYPLDGGDISKIDHSAVQNVRRLLDDGASPKNLLRRFDNDPESLKALRWLVAHEGASGSSASREQAEAISTGDVDEDALDPGARQRRAVVKAITAKLEPDYFEDAQAVHDDAGFLADLANGASTTSAIQAAQIRKGLG